jgi:hypothetical protein
MGRLRGFGLTGAALFLWRAPNRGVSMTDEYEIGYGKPPKTTRFGNRMQPKRSSQKEAAIDITAAINRTMTVARNATLVRMHPHEAMMHGLVKNAMQGKVRAMKMVFLECKKAGLLDAPPAPQMNGFIVVPKGVPMELAARLVRMAGPPPWDADVYDQCMAEYGADRENIEKLFQEENARRDAKSK